MYANRSSTWKGTHVTLYSSGAYKIERSSQNWTGWVFFALVAGLFVLSLAVGSLTGLSREDSQQATMPARVSEQVADTCQSYAQLHFEGLASSAFPHPEDWLIRSDGEEILASCFLFSNSRSSDNKCKYLTFQLQRADGDWRVKMASLK